MKKLLLFISMMTFSSSAAVTPCIYVANTTDNNFKNENITPDSEKEDEKSKELEESNQGYQKIQDLKLYTDIGLISDFSEEEILTSFKKANPVVKEKVYLNSMTLNSGKITIKNYSGFINIKFRCSSLKKIINVSSIGSLENIKSETIFNKLIKMNKNLRNVNINQDLSLELSNIYEGVLSAKGYSDKVNIDFKPTSLDGVILERTLESSIGSLDDNVIISKVIEKNEILKNYKNQVMLNQDSKTLNNVSLYLKDITFEKGSKSVINYSIDDIAAIIPVTNIGEVDKVDESTILSKLKEKNPLLDKYLQEKNKSLVLEKEIELDNSTFHISDFALKGKINVVYKCNKLSGILKTTDIGGIDDYDDSNSKDKILANLKQANPLLKYIKSDFDINISNIVKDKFTKLDSKINTRFDLRIKNMTGNEKMNFKIIRKDIKNMIPRDNLNKVFWRNRQDIINKIKDVNGKNFDENNLNIGNPTYSEIKLSALDNSLKYFGEVIVKFVTIFYKEDNYNFSDFKNTTPQGTSSKTKSRISSSPTIGSSHRNDDDGDQTFIGEYEFPLTLNDVKNLAKKTSLKFKYSIQTEKINSSKQIDTNQYKQARNEVLSVPLNDINGNKKEYKMHEFNPIKIPYRKRAWYGACTSNYDSLNLKTTFKVNFWKENGSDKNEKIKFQVLVSNQLDDYTTCDDIDISYKITIESIDMS